MGTSSYILITQAFAELMEGRQGIASLFNYAVTNDGKCVCAETTRYDFPREFLIIAPLTIIELGVSDFPTPPTFMV